MTRRYEYNVVRCEHHMELENVLNSYDAKGWEVVSINTMEYSGTPTGRQRGHSTDIFAVTFKKDVRSGIQKAVDRNVFKKKV